MKKFTEPEILIENLEVEDVITASGEGEEPALTFSLRDNQLDFH